MISKLTEQFRASELYKGFAAREKSERMIILAVAALVIVSMVWLLIWQPVSDYARSSQERHLRADTLLQWMQANEAQARQIGGRPQSAGSNEGVLSVATRTSKQMGLALTRVQPENSGGVSVVLQKQSFNDLMRWLDSLQQQENLQIIQASVDADSVSGRVNARFSLRR